MKRASLLAVLFAAVVGHVDATEKALNELSTDDLLSLLRLWKLEAAFSKGFKANDYDGDVLEHLVDVDIPNDLPSLQPKFPRADVMQWKKLQKKVRALVEAGGVVDLSILDNVEGEPADEASRRRLDVDAGDFGGIQIRKTNAMVAMGPAGDVALLRQGNASLHVSGDAVSFAADAVSFSGRESFEVNGTDLLQCCQDSQSADNETLTTVRQLKAEQLSIIDSVRILKQELFYLEKRFNASCTSVDEGTYSCNSVVSDYHDECIEEISSDTYIWTDRTYSFLDAPGELLDTYHTYVNSPMSTSPPCASEGGFLGTLKSDAQIAICCANHGTYSSAGNKPYASAGSEGLSYAYGLTWTEHSGEFALGNHGGTPCTFYETFLEAGDHLICCTEGWATGIFVTTPEVVCT